MKKKIKFKQLDLPFIPSASTSYLVLHMEEVGNKNCYAEFIANFKFENIVKKVRMTFKRCINGKLVGFGGDAYCKISIGEIINSPWIDEMLELQNRLYPNEKSNLETIRHFYICGHDVNIEVLAKDYIWEVINN